MNDKVNFELEFVGYMDFESIDEAREFGYKLEEELGEYTKDNVNLYLSNVKETGTDTVDGGVLYGLFCRVREYSRKLKEYYYVEDE